MNDDFFGRPSARTSTSTIDQRPASRPAPARPATRRGPKKSTPASRRSAPAPAARRSTPPPANRAPRPPASRGRSASAAAAVGRRTVAPAPRPTPRREVPTLTGSQLRSRTLKRLVFFVVAMGAIVAAVAIRLVDVQVANSGRYVAYGESQRDGFRVLPASRGAIYDRNGQAFAMSVAQPMVIADPLQVERPIATSRTLAAILGLEAADVEAKLRADSHYRVIAKSVSRQDAVAIKAALVEGDLVGVSLENEYQRSTPSDDLAIGVIGNALPEGQQTPDGQTGGVSGLESEFNEQLEGKAGKLYYEQDVWGKPIAGGERKLDKAVQGTDLYLTLDQALQYEAEQAMKEQVLATGAQSGQAVIMRPSTGEILAMASVAKDGDDEVVNTRDNRSITSVFEPGSVNKMITVAGAIEEGTVTPDTVLTVPDHLQIADRQFTDSHPHPVSDWSVTDIIATSSNIGTIKIAQQLGEEKVDAYLRDFGFGTPSGLGFPGETAGIMKDVEDWSGVDIGAVPIGQGIAVTALQMLGAYNVVANDGVYIAPKLVASTDTGTGQVPAEPSDGRRVISADTAAAMQAMLSKVVSDGTGELAAVPGYTPAGKTGTARIPQNIDPEDGYLNEDGRYEYQASFVGMVNGADLSIIVTLEDPRTSIFGGDVAAPVFAHLAATALRRYEVPPPALLGDTRHEVPELLGVGARGGRRGCRREHHHRARLTRCCSEI
ncbi:peptidoglycan D,D-transpeptidase FtsI family protein [Aquihabitans daechungensis]|uniref:peptidoglycan D,D-transpeptidase FtsI family protein n=1 Tax=Aquihabitans daechungensis TaxID=1052257 RepID=UPI003BA00BEF